MKNTKEGDLFLVQNLWMYIAHKLLPTITKTVLTIKWLKLLSSSSTMIFRSKDCFT